MDVKLKRLSAGHYIVPGTAYHVFRHEGRTFTEYAMLRGTADGFELDWTGRHREIITGGTLAAIQAKVERYFTPRVTP